MAPAVCRVVVVRRIHPSWWVRLFFFMQGRRSDDMSTLMIIAAFCIAVAMAVMMDYFGGKKL
jgi:hypothetical protein